MDRNMDLNGLSLQELKTLQGKITEAISKCEHQQKAEILLEVKALVQSKGFSLDEILNASTDKRAKAPVAPKYADPANPSVTWSGRGRKPKWLVEALENGRPIEDFAL